MVVEEEGADMEGAVEVEAEVGVDTAAQTMLLWVVDVAGSRACG